MIGIFDSGLGGLTTLKELQKILPEYKYLYLGDNANAPYGKRSPERIQELTQNGVEFLFKKGAKIVLIACNTASAEALAVLQKKYKNHHSKKVLGVLIPAVEKALEESRYGNIGLIGTDHTIKSRKFDIEIQKNTNTFFYAKKKKNNPDIRNKRFQSQPKLFSATAPLLVPLIEEGWTKKPETTMILKKYILKLKSCNIDTLILGCTHYPILEKIFRKKMGKNCVIINSGKAQAEKFLLYLKRHPNLEKTLSKKISGEKNTKFFTTDCPEKFKTLGKQFLGKPLPNVEKVDIPLMH